jgi:mannitol/fructose-specific phosphotransferase system IIA component (Ntr-type)
MSVAARLRPELIRIAPPWRSFAETIAGLVDALVDQRLLAAEDRGATVRAVTERERESTTALLDIGAGVPHARLPGLSQTALVLAASTAGLYEAVPTVPIRIVALVLSPAGADADHLHLLAEIATLLRSAGLRAALLEARDGTEALAALERHARSMP